MKLDSMTKADLVAVIEKQEASVSRAARLAKDNADLQKRVAEMQAVIDAKPAKPKEVIKTVTKRVEVPVEKIVEKIVTKRVEVPVEKIVTKVIEKPVEKIVDRVVTKRVEVPVEKVVTKRVEVPCPKQDEELRAIKGQVKDAMKREAEAQKRAAELDADNIALRKKLDTYEAYDMAAFKKWRGMVDVAKGGGQ